MSKAVLISIRPQWCELIANGQKTVEVRKSRPKIETPFKVYIYCTKPKEKLIDVLKDGDNLYGETYHGKTAFIKIEEGSVCDMFGKRQKVIGEFVCDRIYQYSTGNVEGTDISDEDMIKFSCLSKMELCDYEMSAEPKEGCIYLVGLYGWHISNLKIYDRPKELSEFGRYGNSIICPRVRCDKCVHLKYLRINRDEYDYDCECNGLLDNFISLNRPPQSWQYVEVQE